MPVEIIGEPDTSPGASRKQIAAQADRAIKHIVKTCGPPPREMELELQWEEHELGSYPVIALVWEDPMRGAPWEYITECENALFDFERQDDRSQSPLPLKQNLGS
jgi:hypothetical protein